MPRYYFDIADSGTVIRDDEGVELEGTAAARIEAVRKLPDVTQDIPDDNRRRVISVQARDTSGTALFSVMLSLAIVPFATKARERLNKTG